jgi:hypothetical protein
MNTNRVTLTAFGTSGVLLAASLTMLAIVSALVAFDAWPTRDRAESPAEIAVQNPRAARVVRTVRRASATTGSGAVEGAGAGDSDRGLPASPASGGGGGGGGGGDGGGDPGNNGGGPPSGDPVPPPQVGPQPPGEGDPGPSPDVQPASTPPVVEEVVSTACSTVSGVSGGVVGSC